MTTAHSRLLAGLASMLVGWVFALRALAQLGAWGLLAGLAFLIAVGWGVFRAARL